MTIKELLIRKQELTDSKIDTNTKVKKIFSSNETYNKHKKDLENKITNLFNNKGGK